MSNLSMVEAKLPPGFRFHPRDEELICDYLMKKVTSSHGCPLLIQVDLNKCEPWDLPEMACVGGKEWYFYSRRDRKYATGLRTNRATVSGYWKATGKDRPIMHRGALVGMRKTLVFYQGRAPKGTKTNWVMHEFRLEGPLGPPLTSSLKEDWVLCRMFCKNREVTGKQGMSRSSYDNTSSSSLLPPLMDSYINFDQTQSTSIPNQCEQVPCFSISTIPNPNQTQTQTQINPTFSHSNIIDHLVDPKLLPLPTKTPVTTTKSLSTFDRSAAMVPDLGARSSSFSCENTVLKAVLNHLTEMEVNNPSIKVSPSFREGCSESFLSDLGFPTFWNQY